MLDVMRRSSRWLMWVVIIGIGAVFVLYLGFQGSFQGSAAPNTAVAVGDRSYDARDVDRVRRLQQERVRQIAGDGFDEEAARSFLDQQAMETVLRIGLLAEDAERQGLAVSRDELRAFVRRIPGAVDEAGRLNAEGLKGYAESEYGSELRFERWLRDELLSRKLARMLQSSVAVSEAEARDRVRYEQEEVRIAAVRIDTGQPPPELTASEEAVLAILSSEVPRLREAYEQRRSEFDRPEQVRARHILVRAEEGDEEARSAGRERIEAIRQQIVDGAAFEDVAMKESEDSSAARGGDLGFFPRGRMVAPFEEVAFQLEPGVLSEVVETRYGFHLIRVEERNPAMVVPFEEASEELARDLARQDAWKAQAREKAERLAEAVRGGASLIEAAREEELAILRPDPIRRRPDGYIPEVGAVPEAMTAAFSMAEPGSDPTVHEAGDAFVLVQLLERTGPDESQLEALVEDRRRQLLAGRRNEIDSAWIQGLRQRAAEEGHLITDLSALGRY